MYDGWGGLRVKPQKKMGIIIKRGVGCGKSAAASLHSSIGLAHAQQKQKQ